MYVKYFCLNQGGWAGGGGAGAGVITYYEIPLKIEFIVVTSARNNIFAWYQKQLIDITPLL